MTLRKAGNCLSSAEAATLRGFTLIEMVVALAMAALLAVALFESLRFGQRSYAKVIHAGGASWDVFAAQRLIRGILESAYPQEPPATGFTGTYGLQGSRQSLAVTAAAPLAAGHAGLLRYELMLRPTDAGKKDLIVRWSPQLAQGEVQGTDTEAMQEVLVENVASLEWSYQSSPQPTGEHRWREDWQGTQTLPKLIRLRIQFDPADSRRWPELVVAPRVTDDANCVFDAVSQRCRLAS